MAPGDAVQPTTTVLTLALPRAAALTDALLSPAPPPADADQSVQWRERLRSGLAAAGPPTGGRYVRLGAFQLGQALGERNDSGQAGSRPNEQRVFQWSAQRARRAVGLAAVRACVAGKATVPAEATALVMAEPDGPSGVGASGPGSCAEWLASLSLPARALVSAEAVTWATHLWTAIEWRRIEPALVVGPPDRWWEPAADSRVALRGRADLRLARPGLPPALLTMLPGAPRPSSRTELTLAALVDVVTRAAESAPSTVIGWWPDCGRAWVVTVDPVGLGATVDAVVQAVRALREPVESAAA